MISEGSSVGSLVGIEAYGGVGATYALKDDANGRFAIDAEYVSAETLVSDGDEIAFLPPMGGG